MTLLIRHMRDNDLDFCAECTAREGWLTETREEFEDFLALDPAGCFVAEWDGQRAGICVATRYGWHGFVGELIVARAFRSFGIGPRLFASAVDWLKSGGCGSISLDGVRRAAAFYENFGFRTICRSLRLRGRPEARRSVRVRPMDRTDFPRVFALDQQAFGADRSFFLDRRFTHSPELAKLLIENGEIAGYVLGRRRASFTWAGPWWVAHSTPDPGALLADFACETGDCDIRLGVLESNPRALALVRSLGFSEQPTWSWRMTLGPTADSVGLDPGLVAVGTAAKG